MRRSRGRRLEESVVVVTGASSGIGRAAAEAFRDTGARVVAAARDEQALRAVEGVLPVVTDLAEYEQVQRLAARAVEAYGRIDVWVNNAAVHEYGWFEDIAPADFARVVQVDVLGQVYGAHVAIPYLARNPGGGALIGVSSLEAIQAVPLQSPYITSKHALRGLYDTLRIESAIRHPDVSVSTILPVGVDTPIFEHARTELEKLPTPPSPLYAPEVVARSILHAARHGTREIFVGGPAAAVVVGQRFAPALMDRVLTYRKAALDWQQTPEPDPGRDNLDRPVPGSDALRGRVGRHARRVRRHSPTTALLWHHPGLLRAAVGAAGLAATGWALTRRSAAGCRGTAARPSRR